MVTPHWTASALVGHAYTAFVHLLDAAGHLVAQNDAPPLAGHFPTTAWRSGDTIPDSHTITLPPDLPPGQYHLEFGLYDSQTQVRLPVVSGQPVVALFLPLTP